LRGQCYLLSFHVERDMSDYLGKRRQT